MELSARPHKAARAVALGIALLVPSATTLADDELAAYAAEGHKVEVDSMCFMRKCFLETRECGNDPTCLKGLSCLARCKGDSTCSTGCFAAHGSEKLDRMLYCSVEKEDCVKVPRDETRATWAVDPSEERPQIVQAFDMRSLQGEWRKVMGWDQRYDCFDCQLNAYRPAGASNSPPGADRNGVLRRAVGREAQASGTPRTWQVAGDFLARGKPAGASEDSDEAEPARHNPNNDGVRMKMEVQFTLPRPRDERGYRNAVEEEIIGDAPGSPRSMHSKGRMFGLTFWENYYVVAEGNADGSYTTGQGRFPNPVTPRAFESPATSDGGLVSVASPPQNTPPPLPALPAQLAPQTTLTGSVLKDSADQGAAWKFIYYTGHTLQGNYKGAFVYSREAQLPAKYEAAVAAAAHQVGLDITDFCRINNACFLKEDAPYANLKGEKLQAKANEKRGIFPIFDVTRSVAQELSDWFGDPTLLSEWLLAQQERVVLHQPLETSPFADLIKK